MSLVRTIEELVTSVRNLEKVVNRQEYRMNNLFREGSVKEVDFSKGVAVVDAHGMDSKEIPWMEPAGDISEWTPPSVGQRVIMVSPGGNQGRAFIMPGGYTDDAPAPHNQGAQKRIKIGDAMITISGSSVSIVVGGTTLTIGASGVTATVGGVTYAISGSGTAQTGGQQLHDGIDVGKTHTNGGLPIP